MTPNDEHHVQFDRNSWDANAMHVTTELKRLADGYERQVAELVKIASEIAALKVKAGIWGLMGGAIPVVIMIVMSVMRAKT